MREQRSVAFMRIVSFIGAFVLAPAFAESNVVTRADSVYLPPYCKAKLGYGSQAEVEQWGGILDADGGKNFVHLHHYCWALNYINKAATARSTKERALLYGKAISNFDYVITRWSPGCVLLPEAHLKKGQVMQRLGMSAASLAEFKRAIQLEPAYSLGYAAASDWYKENGEIAKARETLKQGLKYVPRSKSLRKRLARLDS